MGPEDDDEEDGDEEDDEEEELDEILTQAAQALALAQAQAQEGLALAQAQAQAQAQAAQAQAQDQVPLNFKHLAHHERMGGRVDDHGGNECAACGQICENKAGRLRHESIRRKQERKAWTGT